MYAVDGLRLDVGAASPCIGTARWRKLDGGACGEDETALDAQTKATLAEAIRSSTDVTNPFVRDAIPNTVEGGSCTEMSDGVTTVGAKVDVDGECWEHSHPFYLNVYEMGVWANGAAARVLLSLHAARAQRRKLRRHPRAAEPRG